MRRVPRGSSEGGRFAPSRAGAVPPQPPVPLSPAVGAGDGPRVDTNGPDVESAYLRFAELDGEHDWEQPRLSDLFPQDLYEECVGNGWVSVRRHPHYPYLIHNYTPRCVWEGQWNEVTLACRGLVTREDSGLVVARPFRKFFNYEQPEAPSLGWDDEVVVMDKADGSLGVLYPTPEGRYAVATRGSFSSEQAMWASELYERRFAGRWEPNPRWTYLYEIVYPENRVVLDYGDTQELILLGAVDIPTGASVPVEQAQQGWPGLSVERFPHRTLREVVEAAPRDNAEGFVVWHPGTDTHVKVKQEDYKHLHRLVTGVTPKHVWEVLAAGDDPGVVFQNAPDEFHAWLRQHEAALRAEHQQRSDAVIREFEDVRARLPEGFDRKAFAHEISRSRNKSLLFLLLDGKDEQMRSRVWQQIRPAGDGGALRDQSSDSD